MHMLTYIKKQTVGLGFGSRPGPIFGSPLVHLEMSGGIFVCHNCGGGRKVLASSGWRLGMLPSTLQSTGQSTAKKWTEILREWL